MTMMIASYVCLCFDAEEAACDVKMAADMVNHRCEEDAL